MIYLTIEDIRQCHTNILNYTLEAKLKIKGTITEEDRLQNTPGELFQGRLDQIVDIFLHPYDNQYMPCTRASRLIYNICTLHPFIEGNKRTAYFVSAVLLNINGLKFNPPALEVDKVLTQISKGEMDEKAVNKWVRKQCKIMFILALPIYFMQAVSIVLLGKKDIPMSELGETKKVFIPLIRDFVLHLEMLQKFKKPA